MKTTGKNTEGFASAQSAEGMNSSAEAKLVVVGAGTIGMRHIMAINLCPGAKLAGVAEKDERVRAELAGKGIAVSPNVERLVEDSQPDGVIIATPTDAHCHSALPVISAGIPVLVEKPIAASLNESEAIAAAATRAGTKVLVGHQRRYHPQAAMAREMIRTGKLGEILLVSGVWGVRKHEGYYRQAFRRTREAGPVMINFIHDIDMLRHVLGEIESVAARLSNKIGGGLKEDAGVVSMKFASGALGSFALSDRVSSPWSWESATGENRIVPDAGQNCFRFMGTESSLDFPNLVHWTHEGGKGDWSRSISGEQIKCQRIDPFVSQLNHFLDVIHGLAKPLINVRDATASLRAALAVLEAADSGCWVELQRPQRLPKAAGA